MVVAVIVLLCVRVCVCVCAYVCARARERAYVRAHETWRYILTSLAGSILPNDVVRSMSADFVRRVSRAAELRGVS